jgi:hypothetical protein
MKKLINILARVTGIFTFAFFISCGDDDETTSVSLVGKWQVESRELFDCPNASTNNLLVCSSSPTASDCGTWEFKTDGSYTVSEIGGGGYTYQYEANPNSQVDFCYNNTCYPYLYSITGNKMIITEGDFTTSCLHKWTFVKI